MASNPVIRSAIFIFSFPLALSVGPLADFPRDPLQYPFAIKHVISGTTPNAVTANQNASFSVSAKLTHESQPPLEEIRVALSNKAILTEPTKQKINSQSFIT
ncbi:hypothetical protein VNO77_16235 [Canavalia gladiata]|uniref:Uncharacterized protein n=1 Tax=Canavalia gladiata TaxID=3824 RepID=A0AAN9M0N9_CANGL